MINSTGLGTVTPSPVTGAPATGLTTTDQKVTVAVDGQASTVSYHGLAPTLIGLSQINFEIPATAKAGSLNVVVSAGSVAGNTATIAMK